MLKRTHVLWCIAAAFLFAAAASADAVAIRTQIKKCKFSIGREHPGAKGSMTEASDGVVMNYDFSGGGLYTGIEYHPGANTADHFELTFRPEQQTRYFLRIKAGEHTFVTKQQTVSGGKDVTIKIRKNHQWRAV